MDLLKYKNIILILFSIIAVSILGLGYLEIKNLKQKVSILEKTIKDSPVEPPKIIKMLPKCIMCQKKDVSPSSMNKYHNRYCIDCATIDFQNTKRVETFMKQSMSKINISNDKQQTQQTQSNTLSNMKVNTNDKSNKVEKIEEIDGSEKIEEIDGSETIEEIDGSENIEMIEEIDGSETIEEIDGSEKIEEIDGSENIEMIEEIEDVEIEDVEIEDIHKKDIIEEINTKDLHPSTSNSIEKLSTIKLDILRNLLKLNGKPSSGNKKIVIRRVIQYNLDFQNLIE